VYYLDEEGKQAGVKLAVALLTDATLWVFAVEGALEGFLSQVEGWPFVVDNTYGAWGRGGRGRLQIVCITGWILTSRAQPVGFPPSRSHPLLKRLHIRNDNGCSVNDADATKALGVAETSQPTQMG
jgi:hypothetical protein